MESIYLTSNKTSITILRGLKPNNVLLNLLRDFLAWNLKPEVLCK